MTYSIPVDEWVEIIVDTATWKKYTDENSTIFFLFDDLESGFGDGIGYYVDEYMMYKREFTENEIESCGSAISVSTFGGSYCMFSYSTTVSHTDDGSGSICMTENGPWPGTSVNVNKSTEEILAYDYVTFWLYIDAPGGLTNGCRELALYNETLGQQYVKNRTWTQFAVDTQKFVSLISDGKINRLITLMNDGHHYASGTKMYIDELMLTKKTFADNELESCANAMSLPNFEKGNDWATVSYTMEMSHTDDGSGCIKLGCSWGWPVLNFKVTKTAEEIRAYDNVTFWIYINSTQGFREDGCKEIAILGETQTVRVKPCTWTKITMSSADFVEKTTDGVIKLVMLQNDAEIDYDPQVVVYIDEIMLENT